MSNGTRIDYEYDKIDRVSKISHSVVGGPAPFLQMIYSYDKRDLITRVLEIDEQHQAGTITYTYDARGRLIEERRTGSHAYHLAYTYDQGGNRTSKTDSANGTYTLYHYDTDADSTAPHKANRLLYYDTFEGTDATGPQVEAVIYTYALEGPGAGNVTQIRRKVGGWPFHVVSTCMKYNEAGELWVVTERTWISFGWGWATNSSSITPNTVKSRQFRGIGRQRYMMRDLDTSDVVNPSYAILPDTAVWTDYDGNWPTSDYTIDATGSPVAGTDYETGFAEIDPLGQVTYMHTDQIGTTRVITDDTGAPTTRPVYTAFGEPVFEDGSVGTRYRYAGAWGYENFTSLDWGTEDWGHPENPEQLSFPYLHVGHRWYDPATGRFLQRDPAGIRGGMNSYAYVSNTPTAYVDPYGFRAEPGEIVAHAGGAGVGVAIGVGIIEVVGIAVTGPAGAIIIGVCGAVGYDIGGNIYEDTSSPRSLSEKRTSRRDRGWGVGYFASARRGNSRNRTLQGRRTHGLCAGDG